MIHYYTAYSQKNISISFQSGYKPVTFVTNQKRHKFFIFGLTNPSECIIVLIT